MPHRLTTLAIACLIPACLTACAGRNKNDSPNDQLAAAPSPELTNAPEAAGSDPAEPSPASSDTPASYLALTALDGRTGEPIAWDDLVDRCAAANVVLIGEEHDLDPAQQMAADLFAAIVARRSNAALSLEFFERDEQVHLDDYVGGLTTHEQFVAATGRRDGNYPDGHRRMIDAAKAAGVRVIASNAPRRYVRLARLEGYDRLARLNPQQRALFVVPRTMPSGRYHDEFIGMMSAMGAHGPEAAGPQPSDEQRRSAAEATFRSQAMWDATMADSIAAALRDGARPVVHVIGRFHVDHDGGTVQMLRRERPSARVLTISCGRGSATQLSDEDKGMADVVVYSEEVAEVEPSPTAEPGTRPEGARR